MTDETKSNEWIAFRESAKGFLFSLTVLCLAGAAVWFGYVQFFTKGLEHLPAKMCEGTVDRNTAIQVLPRARSAEEGSSRQGSGDHFRYYCHVVTSNDSSIWGESQVYPVSKERWLKNHRGTGDDNRIIRVSIDGVEALAELDAKDATSTVYVPCVPPVIPSYNVSEAYAVITEVTIHGDVKTTGMELRQVLTDVAYELTKHTYKLAECKNARNFPEELPRYEDG